MSIGTALKAAKQVVTSKAALSVLKVQKNSPAILFAGGVVGTLGSTVLASKATLRLDETLEENRAKKEQAHALLELYRLDPEKESRYTEKDHRRDITILSARQATSVVRLYLPAIALGVAGYGCFFGAHKILSNRNTALLAAYAALDKGFRDYRGRVVAELGEDKDREFRHGVQDREVAEDNEDGSVTIKTVKTVKDGEPSIYAKFFDQFNNNWVGVPEHNLYFLKAQQSYANDMLRARGHVFLNDVYRSLGMEDTSAGAVVGWTLTGGDGYIDFGIWDGDKPGARDFVNGREGAILLDFNVDGPVWDKI